MFLLLLVALTLPAACDKVPLLAPTGSVISLIPEANNVALNSQMAIVATVIENGVASSGSGSASSSSKSGAGTPVQNGTVITFTTTIGHIEPSEARTHNGQVTVQLITSGTSGAATITAYSGGASTTTKINVGTAAIKTITLSSSPATLGSSGGSATVTATVIDDSGSPVPNAPVTFATDNGTLNPSTATSDASGDATTTLTTSKTAKVTATSGTITAAAALTVTVNTFALSAFTATPNATSAGTPVTFAVTPTTGATISNVRIDFGDGRSQSLGSISAAQNVVHVYSSAGQYTATATVTDTSGGSGSLSTTVIIGSLPITLSASPAAPTVNSPVTFVVGGIGSAQVAQYNWTFDDGTGSLTTTSPQLTHTFTSRGLKNARVDVIGVSGGTIGSASITLDVQ